MRFVKLTVVLVATHLLPASLAQVPAPSPDRAVAEYVLAAGDVLDVRVYNNPELSQTLVVRPDGRVFAMLIGDLQAAGRTSADLSGALQREYEKRFRSPEVAVIVRSFSNRSVFVGGEVGTPGMLQLTEPLTVSTAIIKAGGFKEVARTDSVVLLRSTSPQQRSSQEINVAEILQGLKPDIPLQPGDVLHVPKSSINVFVGGEVTTPGMLALQGRLTVLAAVIRAGGVKTTASLDNIVLLRDNGQSRPAMEKVNLKNIQAGLRPDVELKPFDVVFLPKSRIATMDQFVDQYMRQLLPISINGGFSYLLGTGIITK